MIFTEKWWAIVLRGIAAIIFGLLAFSVPGITVRALVLLFAAYAFVDGAFAIAAAVYRADRGGSWGAMLLRGTLGVVASIGAIVWPGMTALVLLYVIAGWALATGIVEIGAAIHLRKIISGEWMLALSGVLSIVFGAALIAYPSAGILAVVWMIGTYAILFGALLIGLGLRLRSLGRRRDIELGRRAA